MVTSTPDFAFSQPAIVQRARPHAPALRGGFTLVEVLAAMLLIAIALPAVMQAISMSTAAAANSQRRAQAASLAESKLNELVATTPSAGSTGSSGFSLSASSGDFGDESHGFTWTAEIVPWGQTAGIGVAGTNVVQELDVHVLWKDGSRPSSITVSTLVYQSANTSSSGTTGGTS